jgi:hypothetical protein
MMVMVIAMIDTHHGQHLKYTGPNVRSSS